MVVLVILYAPLLAYMWASVIFGVRWARTGRRPPRLVERSLRTQQRVIQAAGIAGFLSVGFAVVPIAPWHHAIGNRLAASGWEWWGTYAAAVMLPAAVVWLLTRSTNPMPVDGAAAEGN